MNRKITIYKSVFDRDTPFESDFNTYLNNPEEIFEQAEKDFAMVGTVKTIKDKYERNRFKRENFPAMELSQSGLLAVDIDNISENKPLYNQIIKRLSTLDSCYVIKDSISGNLVAFFKYDCAVKNYKFLYYKLFLELTILLGVNIDFLPEIGRLRYIGNAGCIYFNEDSEILTEILDVGVLPRIKTSITPKDARGVKYGSH